jgi:hypothetical protein
METVIDKVRTATDGPWEYECDLPESSTESVEVYGEEGTVYLIRAGLKVKKQNVAREGFVAGKPVEEINKLVREYRPGGTARISNRTRAFDLITDRSMDIASDPKLKKEVRDLLGKNDFKGIIAKLSGEVIPPDDEE